MRLTKIFSVSLMCSLFLLSVLGVAGQNGPAVASNARILSYATETDNGMVRADTLWNNNFIDTIGMGLTATTLLANDDTIGGKSCRVADDFTVPVGETWTIDKITAFLFRYKKAPDSCRFFIYADNSGLPDEANIKKTFAIKVAMPQNLYLYAVSATVTNQNIVLTEGNYWLSVQGEYKTGTMAKDTFLTLWWCKDTLDGDNPAHCMDSIGAHYVQYPTPWLPIYFPDQINPYNSVKFHIIGTKAVAINTNNKPNSFAAAYAFPNPASNNITFQLNNPAVRYIQIYDMKGKLLQYVSAKTAKKKVYLGALSNGVYMYQLLDASKKSLDRGRFSVSK